jgi:hypothetical protein
MSDPNWGMAMAQFLLSAAFFAILRKTREKLKESTKWKLSLGPINARSPLGRAGYIPYVRPRRSPNWVVRSMEEMIGGNSVLVTLVDTQTALPLYWLKTSGPRFTNYTL